jgi:hypothetical protein
VLSAWDGSKTALAGSKSGFSRRKFGDLALNMPLLPYPKPAVAEPRYHKNLPNSPGGMAELINQPV